MTRVKICGITTLEDALCAVGAGADALGFVFADSPRRVTPAAARDIIRQLPPFVTATGVFVGDDPAAGAIADECGLQALQLHTGYSEEYVRSLRQQARTLILGVRVRDEDSLKDVPGIESASALLLDSWVPGAAGGTGATFDWRLCSLAEQTGLPVILSGGLTPENVAVAVRTVRPYAVDVSSGVEMAPGRKDPDKVRRFIERAKSAEPSC